MAGILYLVATPIGNLEDITARALRILAEVDVIAAEDTRVSRRLLTHFNISKPLISYYEQNKFLREAELLARLQQGENIALISDAGTPCLSDPGAELVKAAILQQIEVIAVPGASALLTALVCSGMDTSSFCFEGFLPRLKKERRAKLQKLATDQRVLVFYEAPHRLLATLRDMADVFGAERQVAACRELTKMFEEKRRCSLAEQIAYFAEHQPRGEFVLVVEGAVAAEIVQPDMEQLALEMEQLLITGMPRKQAARQLAEKYGIKVNQAYQLGLAP